MPTLRQLAPLLLAPLIAACTSAPGPVAKAIGAASLTIADGSDAGQASLAVTGGRLELSIDVRSMPPGQHGAHLHATGRCEGPAFASAGGHLNPQGKMHGLENPQGSHLGDMPNLTVNPDGAGKLIFRLAGDPAVLQPSLFDSDGAAVVLHASADDNRTDPSGNSGARIACGVLQPVR